MLMTGLLSFPFALPISDNGACAVSLSSRRQHAASQLDYRMMARVVSGTVVRTLRHDGARGPASVRAGQVACEYLRGPKPAARG
jgi:hypothetical protein